MKKCKFKKFLIFTFTVLFLSSTSSGVYAQENVTSQFNSEGQQLKEDDEVVKAKIKKFQNYVVENGGGYDFSDPLDCKKKLLEVEKYKPEAEKLLKAMNDFVKKSDEAKVTAEDFDDYVKTFMVSGEPMKCLPRSEFEQQFSPAVNASGSVKRFYKGFKKIEDVKKFRSGVPVVEGFVRGNCFGNSFYGGGHGINIYSKKRLYMGDVYESDRKTNDITGLNWYMVTSVGEVAEMAVDTAKIKYISTDHLDKIIATLLYYNPEIGNAYKYFDRGYSLYAIGHFEGEEYHNKLKADLFKQVFKFDLSELAEKIKPDYRDLEKEEQEKFRNNFQYFVNRVMERVPEYVDAQHRLFSENEVKPHFVDKRCAVLTDFGLVAKLLGYDASVYVSGRKGLDFENCNFRIVNPGVLTVCTENNPDLAFFMAPTRENLQKIFNDKNSYDYDD